METADLYTRCDAAFAARVQAVAGRWAAPTALPGWDVRALVHHIVVEERWAPPLFAGLTIDEVGDLMKGDQLVPDPLTGAGDASKMALAAVLDDGALERTVHLSFGDLPGAEYARQLAADHLVHAWDLARALGVDDRLDADAVHTVLDWFDTTEDLYREIGVIGPRVPVPGDADEQTQLLARFGRRA
ncbi:MAG: TIGR03086 family protein [Pseudonocardiales bacterium]|nr:TIGR03086 family protein [Pseudonocardiales bacterium]